MAANRCHEHDDLRLQLVLGELALEDASSAMAVIEGCPDCASVRQAEMEQPYYRVVDAAVRSGIRDFKPPAARRRVLSQGLVAIAATLALAVGVLLLGDNVDWPFTDGPEANSHLDRGVESAALMEVLVSEGFEAPGSTFSFETGDSTVVVEQLPSLSTALDHDQAISQPLFADGLESGGTGSWNTES